jgi:tRNA threonylcarbamoyl adenosine modification protein YeaZ
MLVLALDTATPAVTAGVVEVVADEGPQLLASHAPHDARGHGELLAPAIRAALSAAGRDVGDVAAVVVGVGPGPYTGLRVGMVTAAVFAEVRGIAVYGVCSLDAIGAARPDVAELLAVTDARRREVYWARYRSGRRIDGPAVGRAAELDLTGVQAVAGPGAELYAEAWSELPRDPRDPDPVALVRVAHDRLIAGAPSDRLTPLYLRRPDAAVPAAPKRVSQ